MRIGTFISKWGNVTRKSRKFSTRRSALLSKTSWIEHSLTRKAKATTHTAFKCRGHERLTIIFLATDGRMTLQRIWRVLVHECEAVLRRGLSEIDCFGDILEYTLYMPELAPGFSASRGVAMKKMVELGPLGDVEVIQQAIIWEETYWPWMRSDWYALFVLFLSFSVSPVHRFEFYRFPTGRILHNRSSIPITLEPPAFLNVLSDILIDSSIAAVPLIYIAPISRHTQKF